MDVLDVTEYGYCEDGLVVKGNVKWLGNRQSWQYNKEGELMNRY
jgi:hypothetical protein